MKAPGTAARHAAAREALIEEIEFHLEAGASAELLPARLGYKNPESLARRLHRAGRPDLARGLWYTDAEAERLSDQKRAYRRPCRGGCGQMCSRHSKHQVCYACSRHGIPLGLAARAHRQSDPNLNDRTEPPR